MLLLHLLLHHDLRVGPSRLLLQFRTETQLLTAACASLADHSDQMPLLVRWVLLVGIGA